jgi:hypothetical protein
MQNIAGLEQCSAQPHTCNDVLGHAEVFHSTLSECDADIKKCKKTAKEIKSSIPKLQEQLKTLREKGQYPGETYDDLYDKLWKITMQLWKYDSCIENPEKCGSEVKNIKKYIENIKICEKDKNECEQIISNMKKSLQNRNQENFINMIGGGKKINWGKNALFSALFAFLFIIFSILHRFAFKYSKNDNITTIILGIGFFIISMIIMIFENDYK